MAASDLTTLTALKAWLGLPAGASPNDATLAALITAASRMIYALLGRPSLLPQPCGETLDFDSMRIPLRFWPVTSVASLTIDGRAIPPANPAGSPGASFGYLLQPADAAPPGRQQALDVFGVRGQRRRQNVVVKYNAGYAVLGEAAIAPSGATPQVAAQAPFGPWASDLGVAYTPGGPLVAVASSPAVGQYSVAAGVYTFAAGDYDASVAISYGYFPQDLVQAATELAAERFRAADRIGQKSKSIGGQETVSYDTSAVSASVLALLQPYRRITL